MLDTVKYFLQMVGIGINDEDGQGLVEYVLIIALIAIVVVGGFAAVSGGLTTAFTNIATYLGVAPKA